MPQWLHRSFSPHSDGAFPVRVGRFVEGHGYCDERKLISLSFQARIVCKACNGGWMADLETEVLPVLGPLIQKEQPDGLRADLKSLRQHGPLLALWLAKTALTTSYALPGRLRLPDWFAGDISQKRIPPGLWVDVATSQSADVGTALSKGFPTFNGDTFAGFTMHTSGRCFQFCIQAGHLLLRIGMADAALVGYVAPNGLAPWRLFPDMEAELPVCGHYPDLKSFFQLIVLRTWAGCAGEVPA